MILEEMNTVAVGLGTCVTRDAYRALSTRRFNSWARVVCIVYGCPARWADPPDDPPRGDLVEVHPISIKDF